MRTPTIAALVLSLAAVPCAALGAEKAPAARSAAQGTGTEQARPFASVNGVAIPQVEARIILEERRASGTTDSPARPLFVYVDKKAFTSNAALKGFMNFFVENESTIAEAAQYIPLSDEQKKTAQDELAALG